MSLSFNENEKEWPNIAIHNYLETSSHINMSFDMFERYKSCTDTKCFKISQNSDVHVLFKFKCKKIHVYDVDNRGEVDHWDGDNSQRTVPEKIIRWGVMAGICFCELLYNLFYLGDKGFRKSDSMGRYYLFSNFLSLHENSVGG